ncbi:3184_t:CDS:2, partial [Dentiscutata heterogama]
STSKPQKKARISSASDNGDSTSSSSSKLKRQESLMNWYTKPMSQDQHAKIDKRLLDAVVYSNLPFKIIENLYIIKFLNELAPNYKPLSADTLSSKILNNSFSAYLEKNWDRIPVTMVTLARQAALGHLCNFGLHE